MHEATWTAVDEYFNALLAPEDDALAAANRAADAAGLPAIQVAANQGKLLHLLARAIGARRILEIGTLAGYSTIWLARALPPDGMLITLEADAHHARVARANMDTAGLSHCTEVRTGPALVSLRQLSAAQTAPFDLVFVDADKQNNARYLEWALRLTRPGSLIITDNVVRNGAVVDASSTDPSIVGTRTFLDALAAESRVTATAIQTVGAKGYDGFAIALVTGES